MSALAVDDTNWVKVDMNQNRENVETLLEKFAKSRQVSVKYPTKNSATWGSQSNFSMVIMGLVAAVLLGLFAAYSLKLRNRN